MDTIEKVKKIIDKYYVIGNINNLDSAQKELDALCTDAEAKIRNMDNRFWAQVEVDSDLITKLQATIEELKKDNDNLKLKLAFKEGAGLFVCEHAKECDVDNCRDKEPHKRDGYCLNVCPESKASMCVPIIRYSSEKD